MTTAADPEMDALFAEWKKERPGYKLFSNDGILIREEWEKASPKIAFLLKEPNDGFHEIRNKWGDPKKGNSSRFWRNLNIWSYVVSEFYNCSVPTYKRALERAENRIGHIAYVNLKKTDEYQSTTKPANLRQYVNADWEFIKKQLNLISPDVIFCCKTYPFILDKMVLDHLGNGVYRRDDLTLVIDFYHPSCRYGFLWLFERLTEMLNGKELASR